MTRYPTRAPRGPSLAVDQAGQPVPICRGEHLSPSLTLARHAYFRVHHHAPTLKSPVTRESSEATPHAVGCRYQAVTVAWASQAGTEASLVPSTDHSQPDAIMSAIAASTASTSRPFTVAALLVRRLRPPVEAHTGPTRTPSLITTI